MPSKFFTMRRTDPTRLPDPRHRAIRSGDLVVASVLFLITLPLMILVAIAIKCDSRGPIFSREERLYPRGYRFFALKFRSTVHEERPSRGVEPEVTFVGGIMRFLRIDNLPQLVNVVRGEMTCVASDPDHLFFLE
jgi:lipopolysaccharide/colanic/teichoic acid biosynthesis glycosyltransferase